MSDAQSRWAAQLLATLAAAGVRDAVISPGSRSTPLVWAACQIPELRRHAIIDERSAAFYALGQARLSGLPSLLICTSGTAPSHYFPAVIEARLSGVPLIVLSADRPFELQQCGAQQTIDQVRLFGSYAAYHEIGTPLLERGATRALERLAWQAFAAAVEPPRGPVHLNFRAKKPLEPGPLEPGPLEPGPLELGPLEAGPLAEGSEPGRAAALSTPRWVPAASAPVAPEALSAMTERLRASRCPLLVLGAMSLQESPSAELVLQFAAASGAIVCPESVSQLRFQLEARHPHICICDSYDWLLASPGLLQRAAPDFVLQLGGAPLSTNLARLLEDSDALELWIGAEVGWPDPSHRAGHVVRARPTELLRALCRTLDAHPARPVSSEQRLWRAANARARAVVAKQLEHGFGEPEAVRALSDALPHASILVLGNSLPPRLLDRYCPAAARQLRVLSQRGASGIDGLIAGALGAASQADAPTTLLCGDISFLHDVGSLWAARSDHTHAGRASYPLVIVVLNNGGGRIFDQLPMAKLAGEVQHFWTTPHDLRLRGAAELYGLAYWQVRERADLHAALHAAYARPQVSLIEIVVDPDSAAKRLQQLGSELERHWVEVLAES